MNASPGIEISADGLKARCTICFEASRQNIDLWINKGSIANHLKSERHAYSLEALKIQESAAKVAGQSMQEETAMEEEMNFTIFSSTIQPKITEMVHAPERSEEEQGMWDRYSLGNDIFHAGVDHTTSATEERKRLEREATDFDLWHGVDFLSDSTEPEDAQLPLDELESSDITSELLRNACKSYEITIFIDLNFVHRFECS